MDSDVHQAPLQQAALPTKLTLLQQDMRHPGGPHGQDLE